MELKKEDQIKVLLVEPMKAPKVVTIKNELKEFQKIVGGYIECLSIDEGISIICNEEGKLEKMPLNRSLSNDAGEMYEIIAGTFIIVGDDYYTGEFKSLSEEKLKENYKKFRLVEFFFREDDRIKSIKISEQSAVNLGFTG